MRICLLHIVDSPEQFGGAEKVILTLAKEFAKDKDITLAVAVNNGILSDRISSVGVKVYAMPDKGMLKAPSFFVNIRKIIKDFRPDIIHSHHRYTTMLTHFMPRKASKLVHAFHAEQFTRKWNRFFGDFATAVSKGCKEHFVKFFGLNEDFITVIYNGVELGCGDFSVIKRQNGESVISVIGRLAEEKGHIVLIKAISLLPAHVKDNLRVFFVGDGEKRQELVNAVKEAGLEKAIFFVGHVEDVSVYICVSDFTVQPSLREGFGLSIIESFLCGKPVIGSRVGGIPELIIDNITGILVQPNDPMALKDALLHFINNPGVVKKCGETGKTMALERFTVEGMIDGYKAFYKKALAG